MTQKKAEMATTKKPAAKKSGAKRAKPVKESKPKSAKKTPRVKETFAIPASDFALISALKERAKAAGRPTKKSELLRAGLRLLSSLDSDALLVELGRLEP